MFKFNNFKICQTNKKNAGGFTIIELIAVVFVVTVGLVGIYTVSSQITAYTTLSFSNLTASYLAQEGIEIVRNIRDTNWLEGSDWNTGLSANDYEADYNSNSGDLSSYSSSHYLNIEYGSGLFGYGAGDPTKFKRKINITSEGDVLKISVTVSWQEKMTPYSITAQENLYDWYR